MINPAEIPDAFGPFFKVLDIVQEHLTAIIPKAQDQQTREMFAGLLAELQARQTELAVIGPQALADGVAITNAELGKLAVLDLRRDALVAKIDDILARSEVWRADAEAELAVLKAQPVPEPDRPSMITGKKKAEVKLASGKVLHDLLMGRMGAPGPKVLGNIWENWPSK